jgi:hypothetical protein
VAEIDDMIETWSMRPPPLSPEGEAWEQGARQGWAWASAEIERLMAMCLAAQHPMTE